METVLTDLKAVVGLAADNHATGTIAYGAAIDLAEADEALVIVNSGANGSSGTADITCHTSATSGGAKTAIPGAVFTQITEANDNTIYVGRLRFPPGSGKNFLHIGKVIGTANCDLSVTVLLLKRRGVKPVAQVNDAVFDVAA